MSRVRIKIATITSIFLVSLPVYPQITSRHVKIVTLGDSITRGFRFSEDTHGDLDLPYLPQRYSDEVKVEETFAYQLGNSLKRKGIEAEVINVGVGSERSDQALARLDKAVIARRPDIVTVMYGTNDSYVDHGKHESRLPLEEFRSNLSEIVLKLRRAHIVPILMTAPRFGDKARANGIGESPNERLAVYSQVCNDIAEETNALFVDNFGYWSIRHVLGTDIGKWTTDQCHPNVRGHQEILKTMLPIIIKAIQGDHLAHRNLSKPKRTG